MPACRLALKVTPNAPRDQVGPWQDDTLRLKVRAPAVDGKANEAVCALLAARLDLPRRAIRLVRGDTARHKLVEVDGLDQAGMIRRLNAG
jgi:uncharacterized protein YggU (UPF0235/DUF167 family)